MTMVNSGLKGLILQESYAEGKPMMILTLTARGWTSDSKVYPCTVKVKNISNDRRPIT